MITNQYEFVGIVSNENTFTATIRSHLYGFRASSFPMNQSGIESFLKWAETHTDRSKEQLHIILQYISYDFFYLALELRNLFVKVSVVKALEAFNFIHSKSYESFKLVKLTGSDLIQLAERKNLPIWSPSNDYSKQQIIELDKAIRIVEQNIIREHQRITHVDRPDALDTQQVYRNIGFLLKERKRLKQAVSDLVKCTFSLKNQVMTLRKFKNAGDTTAIRYICNSNRVAEGVTK